MKRKFYARDKVEGLCSQCTNAQVIEYDSGKIVVFCRTHEGFRVEEPVSECSMFFDKNKTTAHQFEKIATFLIQNKTGQIGFLRPGTEAHQKFRSGRSWELED